MALPAGFVVSQLHRPEEQDSENTEEDSEETRDKTEVNETLKGVKAEIIEGDKEDSKWLVVNDVQICHKSEETEGEVLWKCSAYRHCNCPFKIRTKQKDNEEDLVEVTMMTNEDEHTCAQDKVGPILHKFRLRLKKRMQEDLRLKFCKIWSEERERLLDSVKDSPEMTTQILMELKDARSYRVAAQRARAKTMPKIPKEHDDMDQEKVPPHCWPFLAI